MSRPGLTAPPPSDAILERLLQLHPKVIDLSLERLERLLAELGNPELQAPPTIHVAGTNGKGSVCAYLRAGLAAGGDRVHAYTSPHLARFHERIRVAGELISEPALAAMLEECEDANGGAPITFFEITTAAAFLAFARTPADWLVLEVGLGGRLDATNVIADPRACVITPLSLDHQQYLGDTLTEIATEKAGILKKGAPCVVSAQPDEAMAAIEAAADRVGAPLSIQNRDWAARLENGRLLFESEHGLLDLPPPRLPGGHQIDNAGAAVAALRLLGRSEAHCAAAMETVEWPARLQRLRSGPLVDAAPADAELWLDGGHNRSAGEALAQTMADFEERAPAQLYLICGMINSKDPEGFLTPFAGLARKVFAAPIPSEPAALSPEDVAGAAVRCGLAAQPVGSVERAIRMIQTEIIDDLNEPRARILICGSLYLAGRVLRENA